MKTKKYIFLIVLILQIFSTNSNATDAFTPLIWAEDVIANSTLVAQLTELKNTVQTGYDELAKMQEQYQELQKTYQTLENTYQSAKGLTDMKNIQDIGSAARQYLPSSASGLNTPYGNSGAIAQASKLIDLGETSINALSSEAMLFKRKIEQQANVVAEAEASYNKASDRFTSLQEYIDKIGEAPDQKQKEDLQARIQAEQLMMQNEQLKLFALAQKNQADEKIMQQQSIEAALKHSASHETPDL